MPIRPTGGRPRCASTRQKHANGCAPGGRDWRGGDSPHMGSRARPARGALRAVLAVLGARALHVAPHDRGTARGSTHVSEGEVSGGLRRERTRQPHPARPTAEDPALPLRARGRCTTGATWPARSSSSTTADIFEAWEAGAIAARRPRQQAWWTRMAALFRRSGRTRAQLPRTRRGWPILAPFRPPSIDVGGERHPHRHRRARREGRQHRAAVHPAARMAADARRARGPDRARVVGDLNMVTRADLQRSAPIGSPQARCSMRVPVLLQRAPMSPSVRLTNPPFQCS